MSQMSRGSKDDDSRHKRTTDNPPSRKGLYSSQEDSLSKEKKRFTIPAGQEKTVLSKSSIELVKQLNYSYRLSDKSNDIKKISDFEIIRLGAEGIQKVFLDVLASDLGITKKAMAEDILNVSVKTIERKTRTEKLDKRTSSHALEVAKVLQHIYDVFENEEKVKRWVNKENRALNGRKPVDLFDTLTGINMVNDILGRIEEGVYS